MREPRARTSRVGDPASCGRHVLAIALASACGEAAERTDALEMSPAPRDARAAAPADGAPPMSMDAGDAAPTRDAAAANRCANELLPAGVSDQTIEVGGHRCHRALHGWRFDAAQWLSHDDPFPRRRRQLRALAAAEPVPGHARRHGRRCLTYDRWAAGVEVTLCTTVDGGHATGDAVRGYAMFERHALP
jgi:hypothetical protein